MNSKVANMEITGSGAFRQLPAQVGSGLMEMRGAGRRLILLYVGVWASMADSTNSVVSAGRRLIDNAEQRGERMEKSAIKRFRLLEEKTVGQLRQLQDGIKLDETRVGFDNALDQAQDDLAERIQSVMENLGIPSRDQLERLNHEIDQLNERIDRELQRNPVTA